MTIVYPIDDTKNPHWQALVKHCEHKILPDNNLEWFLIELKIVLGKYNGKMVIDEPHPLKWIKSLDFETEEDLIFFKLTFN